MKRIFSGLVAGCAFAALTSGALAESPHDWSGFYAGILGGGGLGTVETDDYWCYYACDAPTQSEWFANVGVGAGVNAQLGGFVAGVEADISTGFSNTTTVWTNPDPDGVEWHGSWEALATLRARAGVAVDDALVYVTGGLALASVNYSASEIENGVQNCATEYCASFSGIQAGLVAGTGAEYAVTPNISVKGEALAVLLPSEFALWHDAGTPQDNDDRVTWTSSAYLLRVGVNFGF